MIVQSDRIVLRRMFDPHFHARDGELMEFILPFMPAWCSRALIMPNLDPPVRTGSEALQYRERILRACPAPDTFTPCMTIMLTEETTPETIRAAAGSGVVAVKIYFRGTTTNAHHGIVRLQDHVDVLRAVETHRLLCLGHFERPDEDPFDAERLAHPEVLWLVSTFPHLRLIVEHISDAATVDLVLRLPARVAATITAVHLVLTRKDWAGNVWQYCRPVAKTAADRTALRLAATSGNPKFFFGSDSAGHPPERKYGARSWPGVFSAPVVPSVLATVFEEMGTLDRLSAFTLEHGWRFYWGMPPPAGPEDLCLVREPWVVPEAYGAIVPLLAGQTLTWRVRASPDGARA